MREWLDTPQTLTTGLMVFSYLMFVALTLAMIFTAHRHDR